MRSRAEKSTSLDRYVHEAVIDVARIRSPASGSVVYRSRGNPQNAESVVFSTTRFVSPETISTLCASRVTSAVQFSPPACTKACDRRRVHGCSVAATRTRATAGLTM